MTATTASLSPNIESESTGPKNVEDEQIGHDSTEDKEKVVGEENLNTKSKKAPPTASELRERAKRLRLELASEIKQPGLDDRLFDLAGEFGRLYYRERPRDGSHLQERVFFHEQALALRPSNHPDHSQSLFRTAEALYTLYEVHEANLKHLLRAASLLRNDIDYLERNPRGWPKDEVKRDLIYTMNKLAVTLDFLARETGVISHMDEAIQLHAKILALDPPGRGYFLNDYAIALISYHDMTNDEAALLHAIQSLEEALKEHPPGHSQREETVMYLAEAFDHLYWVGREVENLHESIKWYKELLDIVPQGHPERCMATMNAAIPYSTLFSRTEDEGALERAIALFTEAVDLSPRNHPDRPRTLNNLAQCLMDKLRVLGDATAIPQMITCWEEALTLFPEDHPQMRDCHDYLARCYFHANPGTHDPIKAARHMLLAAQNKTSSPAEVIGRVPLRAFWTYYNSTARKDVPEQVMEDAMSTYRVLVELLPRVASFEHSLDRRLDALEKADNTGIDAATLALEFSAPEVALERLEAARGVFWAQALHLRQTSFDDVPPAMAEELSTLLMSLEHDTFVPPSDSSIPSWDDPTISNRRRRNERVEELISQTRALPGMERFMLGPTSQRLLLTARRGYVVVLLSGPRESRAIFVRPGGGSVGTVALPLVNAKVLKEWSSELQEVGIQNRGAVKEPRKEDTALEMPNMQEKKDYDITEMSEGLAMRLTMGTSLAGANRTVLGEIWTTVVKPIMQALQLEKAAGRNRPRLHWCPTGAFTFLPLHAAGLYSSEYTRAPKDVSCADYVVSSYTPTLTALLMAQDNFPEVSPVNSPVALIGHSAAPGLPVLTHVKSELQVVRTILAEAGVPVRDTLVDDSGNSTATATAATVSATLQDATIAHFACHGTQDSKSPLQSGFHLADSKLTASQLMRLRLPSAVFAFLSACDTARGSRNKPDQSVHLCATMLFCGFRSVVGTLWGMHDMDGPVVAEAVYRDLCGRDVIGMDDIAYALDAAVGELRRRGVRVDRWAPFVHYGA